MFHHRLDYKGDTDEKTHGSDNCTSETEACVINLAEEHWNEEYEEFNEDTSDINDTNKSKISKGKKKILS